MSIELWLITGLIFTSVLLLIIFIYVIGKIRDKSDDHFEVMPVGYSQGIVDIENKEVYVRGIKGSDTSLLYTTDLDDFIYSISINNDSKLFREMLKEINNGVAVEKIRKKLSILNSRFVASMEGVDGYKTITVFEINPNQEFENKINFQMVNSRIPKKKSTMNSDFIEDPIVTLSNPQIFSFLSKEAKKFSTKGVTLIKVKPKEELLSTKGSLINQLNLMIIRNDLKEMGVQSVISKFGELYGVAQNERNKTPVTIVKLWEQRLNLMLSKYSTTEYLNAKSGNFEIYATMSSGKDANSLNTALVELNITSFEGIKLTNKNRNEISSRSHLIAKEGDTISKELKEKKPPIRFTTTEIVDRGFKNLVEFYVDLPDKIVNQIYRHSFKHQEDMLESMIKYVNKESLKFKTDIVTFSISNESIHDIDLLVNKVELKPNFYIMIQEDGYKEYRNLEVTNSEKLMNEGGIKTIQFVSDSDGISIDLFRNLKPDLLLLNRGLVNKANLSHPLISKIMAIEEIKDKSTKIINLK